jgi:phosphinothricin acetyltransferase|tara:strand:- start:22 stop:396 length:375 start_codon:yes stop_codon:yes gene_type:complete
MNTLAAADHSPRIRDAALADITRIAEIYARYVRTSVATFEETPADAVEIAARFHRVTTLGVPWIVIEDAAGVQGYAYAGPFRDRSAYRFSVEDSIYIDVDHLRCGYGMRLLSELISRCEALGKR